MQDLNITTRDLFDVFCFLHVTAGDVVDAICLLNGAACNFAAGHSAFERAGNDGAFVLDVVRNDRVVRKLHLIAFLQCQASVRFFQTVHLACCNRIRIDRGDGLILFFGFVVLVQFIDVRIFVQRMNKQYRLLRNIRERFLDHLRRPNYNSSNRCFPRSILQLTFQRTRLFIFRQFQFLAVDVRHVIFINAKNTEPVM